jgi:hypothetical protein
VTSDGPRSLIETAEQAAAGGDYVRAERLLREAALLQEKTLGPLHPDLANTLNNLGVVCEIVDKPADAEDCYRRAYTIAASSLEPTHPFVATSEKNLLDFYAARGKSIDLPKPATSVAPKRTSRPLVIGVGLAALVIVLIVAARPWRLADTRDAPPREATAPEVASPPPATTLPPAEPIPEPSTPPARSDEATETRNEPAVRSTPAAVTIAEAQLCQPLSTDGANWRCDRVDGTVSPGAVSFYTRLRSPRDTTVEHRWYRGGRLQQAVKLDVRANQGSGYRTYSRSTIYDQQDGEWRVELVAADGALLHQERFVVR